MYGFIKNALMICLLALAPLAVSLPASAGGGDMAEEDMAGETMAEETMAEETMAEETMTEETMTEKVSKDTDVSIYGRFWPRLTYENVDGNKTDITDALSRVGIKANTQITETISAVLHGEWDVDIEQNGNFGDARQAYVGLKSEDLGMLAIGKQWNPYYNVIAEVTDIFYHRASPFGYDNQGPFRTNNYVRYTNNFMGLNIDTGFQADGTSNSNDSTANHSDNVDAATVGASFRSGPAYIGVAYRRANQDDDDLEKDFIGVGGSVNVSENIYLAVTYQYIMEDYDDGTEANPYTLDIASAFTSGSLTALAGFYMSDPDGGASSKDRMGYNVTLIKEVHPALDVFVEWVQIDFDNDNEQEDSNTLSLGFRYDFDVQIF